MRNIGKRPKTVWLAAAAAMMCLVTDERNYQFVYTNLTSYEGVLAVREATRFHPMYNIASWASHAAWFNEEPPKLITGEETTGFERINKDIDFALPDIWRSNISYFYPLQAPAFNPLQAPASAVYQIQSLDATAILNAYWIDMALDDGTPEGLAACMERSIASDGIAASGDILLVTQTPKTSGRHILVIETADAFLFAAVNVGK